MRGAFKVDGNSFDKLINRILDKKYKIENVVGVGGMAYVLKAKDLENDRTVAIKILSDEYKDDERAVKRFINESKTVAMLDHPNIVKIYDVVITDERKYIVMEFIDGITLKDYIDKIGVLSWKEACYYVKQILKALSHAHDKQVIHRDVKPQNIMLLADGKIKVTDFGIAKIPNAESITMTDKAIGTVNYISPEQASGTKVDFRTDIYSTGVMLYEMLTGRLPFIADSPVAVAMMQVSNEPLSPREINSQIPEGLEQIIMKSMQKKPDDRFLSAQAMLNAIEYFTDHPDVVFAENVSSTGGTGAKEKKGEYENKEKKKKKMLKYIRGSRSMFPIVAGIAAAFAIVAIVSAIIWIFPLFKGTSNDKTIEEKVTTAVDKFLGVDGNATANRIEVPDFVGSKYDENLVSSMKEQGFEPDKINYVKNSKFSSGTVVKQEPEAKAIRVKPSEDVLVPVTLYVNMGGEEMKMPDCTLMYVNDAKRLISSEVNLMTSEELSSDAIEVVEEYHDSYPADYVIRTSPEGGDIVKLTGDIKFTVYVSKGQKISNTTVPLLEGKKLDEARRSIISAGLSLGRINYEESKTVGPGLVIKASKEEGETAAKGITMIDLWVSIGSEEYFKNQNEIAQSETTYVGYDPDNHSISTRIDNRGNENAGSDSTNQGGNGELQTESGNNESTGSGESDIGDIAGLIGMRNGEDNG